MNKKNLNIPIDNVGSKNNKKIIIQKGIPRKHSLNFRH